jgi:hypothetical protein
VLLDNHQEQQMPQIIKKDADESLAGDLIRGADAIAEFLGLSRRQAFHGLQRGHIVAVKEGSSVSPRRLAFASTTARIATSRLSAMSPHRWRRKCMAAKKKKRGARSATGSSKTKTNAGKHRSSRPSTAQALKTQPAERGGCVVAPPRAPWSGTLNYEGLKTLSGVLDRPVGTLIALASANDPFTRDSQTGEPMQIGSLKSGSGSISAIERSTCGASTTSS